MAGIRRHFMGWNQPLLRSVTLRWHEEFTSDGMLDLSGVQVVLPLQQAGERLLHQLEQSAIDNNLRFAPPQVCTLGALPELLYRPRRKIASDLQQTLAWTHALSSASDVELEPLLPNQLGRDAIEPWMDLAQTLKSLCEELAADALTPNDVIAQVDSPNDRARWLLIKELRTRYLARLEAAGLADAQEERRFAVQSTSAATRKSIYLVGCADIGSQTCQLLEAVRTHVTAWIAAPIEHKRLFDRFGRVEPREWLEFEIAIHESQLIPANDAQEQASVALAQVQTWRANHLPDEIHVGITDDGFANSVESELDLGQQTPYRMAGAAVSITPPGRLLRLLRDHLQSQTWESLAALIRHADVLHTLTETLDCSSLKLLGSVDQFRNDHLPTFVHQRLPDSFGARDKKSSETRQLIERLRDWIDNWVQPLVNDALPLRRWCESVLQVLRAVFPADAEDGSRSARAMQRLDELFQQFEQLPDSLDVEFSAVAAIDLITQRLDRSYSIIDARPESCTEIVGWLDLSLDDSKALVVVGMNHPFVPKSVTSDPFLPGTLRSTLNVQDNERRFARDAYILQTALAGRASCCLVVGKFGPDGSPTPPSRLLAACSPDETVHRIQWLLLDRTKQPAPATRWAPKRLLTHLPIPAPQKSKPLKSISVTAFRDYLTCPNRFYLRHVLGLRPVDDEVNELAANQFGDLIHTAVELFGLSDDQHLKEEDAIFESVVNHLRTHAVSMYGANPNASVRLQIQQAELRLRHFASEQAKRRAEGWTIREIEASVEAEDRMGFEFDDGQSLWLKGRVDRIDYHPDLDQYAILDYKTHGHKPLKKHLDTKNDVWHDLQLPLYLEMLPALGIETERGQVSLGYFNIAENARDTGVHLADFEPQQLESAARLAREIARAILDQVFEPATNASDVPFDDYAMIFQSNVPSIVAAPEEGD